MWLWLVGRPGTTKKIRNREQGGLESENGELKLPARRPLLSRRYFTRTRNGMRSMRPSRASV